MTKKDVSITKITRPKISNILLRKRLFQLIDTRRKYPVIWIAGPPGSGKTTLAASYIDTRKLSSIWYQVDERDSDIATFFYYMGMAVKKAVPLLRKPLPLLTSENQQDVSLFTKRYFEILYNSLKPPFCIFFDSPQDFFACSEFNNIILRGMDIIPEGVNIIILSRNEPSPQFTRLRANNQMALLVWDDIRFTQEEFMAVVSRDRQLGLIDETVSYLYNKTQGWIAGLRLVVEDIKKENISIPDETQYEKFNELACEGFLTILQAKSLIRQIRIRKYFC